MPNGTTLDGDTAPAQSPVQVSGLSLIPGQTLNFSVTGAVNNVPSPPPPTATADGVTSLLNYGPNFGISRINAPLNSLLGVFLDNSQPDLTPAPAPLDFSAIGLNFSSLAPQVKQVFFIGDGLTGTGSGAVQNFIVPTGATRLFLGPMDGFGWKGNTGSFTVTVQAVPEPSTVFGLGVLGFGAFFQYNLAKSKKSNKQDK
ncbi:MAG: PEP-CTERM sorting domain-containing protein [Microcystis novacekii Mn_MB_F_20050700_S1]|uniref:PEP-CTERM sorting domain-containing protein n=1 Tax=Microcystis novacekii Mn_MB_F_20050700_S1D TaxID=2486266 RepID=A0A552IFM0_9CHRO|nr:MAG: PEP-CTERM sorting domain-containing protein [Microcystis novacekii Mn_MB_F_20050700_S1D]TRU93045.1 MAG: PEP-CTERM sorting domain-containing protein [Microcystis novacekii Mn_MB_F_20050700_S1]